MIPNRLTLEEVKEFVKVIPLKQSENIHHCRNNHYGGLRSNSIFIAKEPKEIVSLGFWVTWIEVISLNNRHKSIK
jgi:hypothetical protein